MLPQMSEDRTMRRQIEARFDPEFTRRCVDLARRYDVPGHTKHVETCQNTTLFLVASRAGGKRYAVICDRSGCVWCDCPAGCWDRPCWHAGAAILVMRLMARASEAYAVDPEAYAGQHAPLKPTAKAISIYR